MKAVFFPFSFSPLYHRHCSREILIANRCWVRGLGFWLALNSLRSRRFGYVKFAPELPLDMRTDREILADSASSLLFANINVSGDFEWMQYQQWRI